MVCAHSICKRCTICTISDILREVKSRNFNHLIPYSIRSVIAKKEESDPSTSPNLAPKKKQKKDGKNRNNDGVINEGKN